MAMDKNASRISKLITDTGFFNAPDVSFFSEGHGNRNYLIEEGAKRMLFREKKSKEEQFADSLVKEYSFLRYAEYCGLEFCPKVFFYSEKKFLLEEILVGDDVRLNDLTNKQLDSYAMQLARLTMLNIDRYFDFCNQNDINKILPYRAVDELQKYGFNRYEEANTDNVDRGVLDWMKERLDKNHSKLKDDDEKQYFDWGDIPSRVLIDPIGNIKFYDFEHIKIRQGNTLSYLKIHGKIEEEKFDVLVKKYAKYTNQSEKEMRRRMKLEEGVTRVNDVVWAAMKWANTDEEKYKDLTYERIKKANDFESEK